MVIYNMREKRAAYNLISNNCQNFAVNLLDAIHVGAHRQFATTFAVYQRATGAGTIKDLFQPTPEGEVPEPIDQEEPETQHVEAVAHAQKVMDDNTTQIDNHEEFFREERR